MEELLVWPLTVAFLVIVFCLLFYRNIGGLLDRAKSIKLPGGFHAEGIEPAQQQIPAVEAPLPHTPLPPEPGDSPAAVEELGGTLRDPLFDPIEEDARARITRNVPDPKFHLDWALRLFATAAIQRDNEQTYRLIFGSQIKALRLVASHGGRSKGKHLRALYEETRSAHLEPYQDFGFEKWIGFLQSRLLIDEPQPDIVTLTPRGYCFLSFLMTSGASEEKYL